MSLQFVQAIETSRNTNDLTIKSMSYTYKLPPTHQVWNLNGQLNKPNEKTAEYFRSPLVIASPNLILAAEREKKIVRAMNGNLFKRIIISEETQLGDEEEGDREK